MEAIVWKSDRLALLDQRLLPFRTEYLECPDAPSVAQAIKDMVVRGAPAIGVSAMYGLVLSLRQQPNLGSFQAACQHMATARPTAVNLFDAIGHLQAALKDWDWQKDPFAFAERVATAYHQEDLHKNYALGKWGAEHLPGLRRVLTHCNTGSLATSGFGTALGIVRQLHHEGRLAMVYADETRPYLQGARLTQWECRQDKIPCTLVTDGMGGYLMAQNMVDCVIVGADRIAANGDAANKIGTFMLAMAAKYHGLPFIVAAPSTTIDLQTSHGGLIPIEQRSSEEITSVFGHPIVPADSQVFNPAFDITPSELISAIVTEDGVFQAPYQFGS